MKHQFQHVKVVIVPDPSDQKHVAILQFITEGRGNVLPEGAAWLREGVWIRAPEPRLIEQQILKWQQIGDRDPKTGEIRPRPRPLRWFIAKDEHIPKDRSYRNAQVAHDSEPHVVHHMPLARELHRDKLRQHRLDKLALLDKHTMAAQRAKDEKLTADIDAEKQLLLDATADPRIESAQTIEDLKAVTLDGLLQEAQARGHLKAARSLGVGQVP